MPESVPLLGERAEEEDHSYFGFVLSRLGLGKASAGQRVGAFLAFGSACALGVWGLLVFGGARPVSVIMIVSDGFGPASQTLARNYNAHVNALGPDALLPLDHILVGSSRTRSSDSFVTDSAAGATAFSCALKSYNGAIGVDPNAAPCGTILEAAKLKGMWTGLVATSRVTHATPASFSAHVIDRDMEDDIAVQQIGNYSLGRAIDLIFAGGSCHFKPQTGSNPESCRADSLDLLSWGREQKGWNIFETVNEFRNLDTQNPKLPLMGLFTPDHMSFEIDRDDLKEPSLKEMALKALHILDAASQKNRKGFFIMIEGSRIDMAAHTNDPAAHVKEILAYNSMIESVYAWVSAHPNTVMISTSDHETGGLSVACQRNPSYPDYAWYPSALVPVCNSTETLGRHLASFPDKLGFPSHVSQTVLPLWLGITDATTSELLFLSDPFHTATEYSEHIARMVSDRAGLGWSTHGHSAVDVNLYAHGFRSSELRGNHENTDIGEFMARILGVNLARVTEKLRSGGWWTESLNRFAYWAETKEKLQKFGYQPLHYHTKE